jgi:hypothetical protein
MLNVANPSHTVSWDYVVGSGNREHERGRIARRCASTAGRWDAGTKNQ